MAEEWRSRAACRGKVLDPFFSDHAVRREIREMCAGCPVRAVCLEYVMDFEGEAGRKHRSGYYGGLTAEERYQLYCFSVGNTTVKPRSKRPDMVATATLQQWQDARVDLVLHG